MNNDSTYPITPESLIPSDAAEDKLFSVTLIAELRDELRRICTELGHATPAQRLLVAKADAFLRAAL